MSTFGAWFGTNYVGSWWGGALITQPPVEPGVTGGGGSKSRHGLRLDDAFWIGVAKHEDELIVAVASAIVMIEMEQ